MGLGFKNKTLIFNCSVNFSKFLPLFPDLQLDVGRFFLKFFRFAKILSLKKEHCASKFLFCYFIMGDSRRVNILCTLIYE